MKRIIPLLLLVVPLFSVAQKLLKCNDSISYFIEDKDSTYFSIKLIGNTVSTDNPKVINFNNTPVQILCINTKDYIENGNKESMILSSYIYKETEYFSGVFNHKLEFYADPIRLADNKLSVLWYFDIPVDVQNSIKDGSTPAIKIISISMIYQDYILSIGITQFKNDEFESLKKMLINFMKQSQVGKGSSDRVNFCNKM